MEAQTISTESNRATQLLSIYVIDCCNFVVFSIFYLKTAISYLYLIAPNNYVVRGPKNFSQHSPKMKINGKKLSQFQFYFPGLLETFLMNKKRKKV